MDMEDQLEREMAAEEEEQLVQMALDHEYANQNPLCKEFSLPADFTFKSLPPSPLYQSKSRPLSKYPVIALLPIFLNSTTSTSSYLFLATFNSIHSYPNKIHHTSTYLCIVQPHTNRLATNSYTLPPLHCTSEPH